jgi:hypothetical protein
VSTFVIPLDPEGNVQPHDHPNFGPGRSLIRRISAEHIVPDKNRNCDRLSSAVFAYDEPANYLSCDSATCIEALDKEPADWVMTEGWLGALALPVDRLRQIQNNAPTKVGMVPLETNVCHGGVWAKITRGRANDMLRSSAWLVEVPNVAKSDEG